MVGVDTHYPTTLSRLATTEDFSVVQLDTVVKGTTALQATAHPTGSQLERSRHATPGDM